MLEKDYKYPVEIFDCYYFPRKNSRSIQGGGYVALVKKRNIKNIVFVKNQFDSNIWLQIRNFIVLGDFKTVNELLSLCKSRGLRILNGRHNHGLDRAYSFIGARGLSVVDYCISTPNVFHLIEKCIISNFTTFSDHAPLHLQFKTKTSECKQSLNPCGDSVNNARPARTFRWNPEYEYEAKLELRKSLESLMCFSKSQMKNLKTK